MLSVCQQYGPADPRPRSYEFHPTQCRGRGYFAVEQFVRETNCRAEARRYAIHQEPGSAVISSHQDQAGDVPHAVVACYFKARRTPLLDDPTSATRAAQCPHGAKPRAAGGVGSSGNGTSSAASPRTNETWPSLSTVLTSPPPRFRTLALRFVGLRLFFSLCRSRQGQCACNPEV